MANQNLSQFGEKLFVADADHTFIWDTAASISKRVSRNSWLNSGTLTSDAPVTISQTWNNAAVAFTGVKVNAVNTASAAASLLLDLQVGGVSQFNVNKLGNISFPGRYSTASIATQTNSFAAIKSNYGGGIGAWMFGGQDVGSTVALAGDYIGFNNIRVIDASTNADIDTRLYRDGAANTLALRNGAAAQTFRVYNTYTDASNYERGLIGWVGGIFEIGSQAAGTGATRHTRISSVNTIAFATSGIERWRFSSAGNLIADADNAYDIGASGASRPRNVYVGSDVISRPSAAITPSNNGEFVVEATSNTTLTFKLKGTDGTVRTGTITLA